MATDVTMPKFGLTMQEATIVRWLKNPGEKVTEGETLLEIETEKIVCEVQAPASGTLSEICVPEGTVAPVGGKLAVIG
jgi:pyruvate/2-oxoglutarate dehydrogenase complex dihydrolipoamide acyltransferase (E2) component